MNDIESAPCATLSDTRPVITGDDDLFAAAGDVDDPVVVLCKELAELDRATIVVQRVLEASKEPKVRRLWKLYQDADPINERWRAVMGKVSKTKAKGERGLLSKLMLIRRASKFGNTGFEAEIIASAMRDIHRMFDSKGNRIKGA